jgi:hypothetical protein
MKTNEKMNLSASWAVILNVLMFCVFLVIAVSPLPAQSSNEADRIKGNLVSAGWLEKNLNNAGVLILDSSPYQIYAAQHIPGAVSADLLIYGIQEMPVAEMEQLY